MKNGDKPITPLQDLGYPSLDAVIREDTLIGLTKREYFASKAMQGICMVKDIEIKDPKEIAALSVYMADALLAELEKQ